VPDQLLSDFQLNSDPQNMTMPEIIYHNVSDYKCILYLPLDRAAYLQAQNLTVTHGIVLWYHGMYITVRATLLF
jgi:hypothetical protein